jgi:hypothetical protein
MNRKFLLTISLSILYKINLLACDLCGCGNGSSFFGILPQSHRSFVGMRYSYKSFNSHLNSRTLQSKETFQKSELWGRFYPFKNMQIMGFLPYNFNEQKLLAQNKTTKINGIGDATILANYSLLNTLMSDSLIRKFDQNLSLGIGTKLPTGHFKYDLYADDEVANPNFQLGTGSVDLLLNVIHTIKRKNFGLNTDVNYKINSKNSKGYKFGNKTSANMLLFYSKYNEKYTVMPNIGLSFEHSDTDKKDKSTIKFNGGNVILGNIGVENYFKKVSLGINYQAVVRQNLANGELKSNNRLNLHFTHMIK